MRRTCALVVALLLLAGTTEAQDKGVEKGFFKQIVDTSFTEAAVRAVPE